MKKVWFFAALLLTLAAISTACSSKGGSMTDTGTTQSAESTSQTQETEAVYHAMEQDKAYERMTSGDTLIVLDVRTAAEYEEKHIPGAINIPVEELEGRAQAELKDKNSEILVYCRSGNRSKTATELLASQGYTKAYDFGGINTWKYDTLSGAEAGSMPAPEKDTDGVLGNFSTNDLSGQTITQDIWRSSKLNMVNIWSTSCGPCLSELPILGEIAAQAVPEDVKIVGILVDIASQKDLEYAVGLVNEKNAMYTHLLLSRELMDNYINTVNAVPTTIFLDSEGNMVGEPVLGAKSKDKWLSIIAQRQEMLN